MNSYWGVDHGYVSKGLITQWKHRNDAEYHKNSSVDRTLDQLDDMEAEYQHKKAKRPVRAKLAALRGEKNYLIGDRYHAARANKIMNKKP